MAATHTDYKISRETVTADAVTVLVRFYTGEYVTVDDPDGPTPGSVDTYRRTGGVVAERVLTFDPARYTRRKLVNLLNDSLDSLNALPNIPQQARLVTPSLVPRAVEALR